jgi:periplasmic divalent cation tolerance protein
MPDVIQVSTTVGTREAAEAIAQRLVADRLAACAQFSGPITSIYRWEGKLEKSQEWLCTVKTLRSKYAQVEAAIRKLHSYQQPEIVAVAVIEGSEGYLSWVAEEVGQSP